MCYVSSVDYGRIILVKMTYEGNIKTDELEAEVKTAFGAYEAGGSYSTSSLKEKTTFDGLILGGSAGGAASALTSENRSLDGMISLIKDEAEYTPDIQAYPISYTVKNLADNSIVKLGETTEYTVKEYTLSDENYQEFDIYMNYFRATDTPSIYAPDIYYLIKIQNQNGDYLVSENNKSTFWYVSRAEAIGQDLNTKILIEDGARTGIKIPSKYGEFFKIEVEVTDRFSYKDDQDAGKETFIHSYPWNDGNPYNFKYGRDYITEKGLYN